MRVTVPSIIPLLGFVAVSLVPVTAVASDYDLFEAPFDSTRYVDSDQPMSLSEVLTLVARANPTFRALDLRRTAAQHQLDQAGLWLNPQFESEFENISWDARGFEESEMTLMLSQEFQIFGQRGARRQRAQAGIDAVSLDARLSAFDLFLDVKSRFHALAHAQRRAVLADSSVGLAKGIQDNITYRLEKGAALQSELLLARLEWQRVQLAADAAAQDLVASRVGLTALWSSISTDVTVRAAEEPDLSWATHRLAALTQAIDSSRSALTLQSQAQIIRAEHQLGAAQARPGITLSGGYRRLQELGINSLVFGLSLPLPLFDRNQGTRASLDAQLHSLEYEKLRVQLEASASIRAGAAVLTQLIHRHDVLDSTLLPTADEAYTTLQQAYNAGRLPYTNLLAVERALIELRFEHNDVLLAIHNQVIALERISGVRLQRDFE